MSLMRKREVMLSLKYGAIEGCFSVPMLQLTMASTPFVILFAVQVLGWNTVQIGYMTALPFICNFLQPLITLQFQKFYSQRQIIIISFIINAMPWAFVAFFPWFPNYQSLAFALIVIASTFAGSLGHVAWTAAMSGLVPINISGKYFSKRNLLFGMWALLTTLAASQIVDIYSNSLFVFGFIFSLAAGCRMIGGFYFVRMKFPRSVYEKKAVHSPFAEYRKVVTDKNFMILVLFTGLFGFFRNMGEPFFTVFLANELNFSVGQVTVLTSLAAIGGLVSIRTWGKLSDRFGNKPVIIATSILWMGVSILSWIIAGTHRYHHLYFNYFFSGFATVGFMLASFNLLLKMIQVENKMHYVSVYVALTSLIGTGGSILGGKLLKWLPHYYGEFLGQPITHYHLLFVFSLACCLFSVQLLRLLSEPAERPLGEMIDTMKTMREFNPVLGLSHLAQYIFTPTGFNRLAKKSIRSIKRGTNTVSDIGEDFMETGYRVIKEPLNVIALDRPHYDQSQNKDKTESRSA